MNALPAIYARICDQEVLLLTTWLKSPTFRKAWDLETEEFFSTKGQAIAKAARVLDDTGDDLTVKFMAPLFEMGLLKKHWELGEPVLAESTEWDPTAKLAKLHDLRALALLHRHAQEALSAVTPDTDPSELRNTLREAMSASEGSGAGERYSHYEALSLATVAMIDKSAASPGVPTGYQEIDEATGGLKAGHVWTLGAPTNWGKSFFLLSLKDRWLTIHRKGVLLVTCEDAPELLMARLLSRRTGISGKSIRDGDLTGQQLSDVHLALKSAKEDGEAPVLLDGRGKDVDQIAGEIRTAVKAHKVELVLVDYLQCIQSKRKHQDRRSEINYIGRTLTDAIKTSGAAGVLASQLTGESLRESRDLEHAAEVVLIGRRHELTEELSIYLAKNKTGPRGLNIALRRNPITGSFINTTDGETLFAETDDSWDN